MKKLFTISCKARDLTRKVDTLNRLWQGDITQVTLDKVLKALGPQHALCVSPDGRAEAIPWEQVADTLRPRPYGPEGEDDLATPAARWTTFDDDPAVGEED